MHFTDVFYLKKYAHDLNISLLLYCKSKSSVAYFDELTSTIISLFKLNCMKIKIDVNIILNFLNALLILSVHLNAEFFHMSVIMSIVIFEKFFMNY